MNTNHHLVLALDVTDRTTALEITKQVFGYVSVIKVGYPLILTTGINIISEICKYTSVIADLKIADIPNTNRLICEQVFKAGAKAIIVHGFTGKDSLDACIDVAKKYNRNIIVIN